MPVAKEHTLHYGIPNHTLQLWILGSYTSFFTIGFKFVRVCWVL